MTKANPNRIKAIPTSTINMIELIIKGSKQQTVFTDIGYIANAFNAIMLNSNPLPSGELQIVYGTNNPELAAGFMMATKAYSRANGIAYWRGSIQDWEVR